MYAKILVGEFKGQTLFVKELMEDGLLIVSVNYQIHEYIPEEYVLQKPYKK